MPIGLLLRSVVAGSAAIFALLAAVTTAVAQVEGDQTHAVIAPASTVETPAPGEDGTDPTTAATPAEPAPSAAPAEEPIEPDEEAASTRPPHLDAARLAVAEGHGRAVYRRRCAACHGIAGDGRGPAARFLEVAPRNFTTGVYKWRTTGSGELPTDADLLRTVRRGVPGTAMPGWDGRMAIRDMWAAIQYLKTLSPRFREEEPVEPLAMPERVPAFDAAARQRGRLVYVLMACWRCHGMSGQGDGPAAATLVDDDGLPIAAYDFTRGHMRGGTRPIDIYRTFATGVNGTPMPSYDEALLVGRDGYSGLGRYGRILTREGLQRLQAFVRAMPTTEELWAMPGERRTAWGNRMRWDLVAYVLSLSNESVFWRYLWAAPYVTR